MTGYLASNVGQKSLLLALCCQLQTAACCRMLGRCACLQGRLRGTLRTCTLCWRLHLALLHCSLRCCADLHKLCVIDSGLCQAVGLGSHARASCQPMLECSKREHSRTLSLLHVSSHSSASFMPCTVGDAAPVGCCCRCCPHIHRACVTGCCRWRSRPVW